MRNPAAGQPHPRSDCTASSIPPGVLPQAAWRLDPDPPIWPDEVLVDVERLNLDAASFRQLREAPAATLRR